MKIQNPKRKKELIKNGTYKNYSQDSYILSKQVKNVKDFKKVEQELIKKYKKDFKWLNQLKEARKKQKQKLKDFINFYLNLPNHLILFCSFTYDSNKRKNPNQTMRADTLKKYVLKAIEHFDDYKINVDFGARNGRLHYHCILIVKKGNPYLFIHKDKEGHIKIKDTLINEYENKVGFIDIKEMGTTQQDIEKVTRYCSKLVNHAIKEKQKYISSKKGTIYQKYAKVNRDINKANTQLKKRFKTDFITLKDTFFFNPKIEKEYNKINQIINL